MKSVTILVTIF